MIASNTASVKELFNQWVNEHSDEMYRWTLYKVSDRHTAEDLVQDTFLAAFAAIESFKGDSSAKTWLFSILNRKIIDYYRKAARNIEDKEEVSNKAVIEQSDALFNDDNGWQSFVTNDYWSNEQELLDNPQFNFALNNCLGKLPKQWETSLLAKYILQKDSKLICKELEITASNYWQMLHRAKLLLKKCLETTWFNS